MKALVVSYPDGTFQSITDFPLTDEEQNRKIFCDSSVVWAILSIGEEPNYFTRLDSTNYATAYMTVQDTNSRRERLCSAIRAYLNKVTGASQDG